MGEQLKSSIFMQSENQVHLTREIRGVQQVDRDLNRKVSASRS